MGAPERLGVKKTTCYEHNWWCVLTNIYDEDAVEYVRADLAPGWQPIETAPKDGTLVDLWCINHLHYAKAGQRVCGVDWGRVTDWMGNERKDWRHGHGEDFEPTHWMPLPAAPEVL